MVLLAARVRRLADNANGLSELSARIQIVLESIEPEPLRQPDGALEPGSRVRPASWSGGGENI